MLSAYPVDAVKGDHNRDLPEAGSALLDALREAHPGIGWESCASGGGRVDLGVLDRVQRIWTSDMPDAVARQQIQRWTTQPVAPEYVGAHISSPTSHTTGRTLGLDFRAATGPTDGADVTGHALSDRGFWIPPPASGDGHARAPVTTLNDLAPGAQ